VIAKAKAFTQLTRKRLQSGPSYPGLAGWLNALEFGLVLPYTVQNSRTAE